MTVRVAVVGYGSAGRQHVQALSRLSVTQLAYVLETDRSVDTGDLARIDSWDSLLNDREVDLVALCLPPGNRKNMVYEALASGKSVLLEKPACTSEAELNSYVAAADKAQRHIGAMFQHRYRLPAKVWSLQWDGRSMAILEVSRPRNADRYFMSWRTDKQQCFGGISAHLGVHYLDIACQLLGLPSKVHQTGRRDVVPGIDMRVAGTIDFASGATMAFGVTSEADARSERLTVLGPDGRFTIENGTISIERDAHVEEFVAVSTPAMRMRVYEDMAEAITQKSPPGLCHMERARGVTRVLEVLATTLTV